MKRLLIISLVLLTLPGCTLFQFGGKTEKKIEIPSKPKYQQPEMKIAKQQATDVIVQIAKQAYMLGLEAKSNESTVLLDAATIMQVIEGIPVDRVSWQDAPKVQELLGNMKDLERDYREKVTEWETLMQELSENESKIMELHKKNGSLWNWIIGLSVLLGIFVFLFPSVGVPLVVFLIKRAKALVTKAGEEAIELTKDQFSQVVNAIEETKTKMKDKDPEMYNHMMANLKKSTDAKTRETINELKVKNHK